MKQKLRVFLTLLLCAVASVGWGQTISTLMFTNKCNGSGTANDGAVWTVTSDGTESTYAGDDGIHYGTNNASVTYLQLNTDDISGTISSIVVKTRDAQEKASVTVKVGDIFFTCNGEESVTATNTSTEYEFVGSGSGEIIVRVDRGSSMKKAIYLKSIIVTYTNASSGPVDPTVTFASDPFELEVGASGTNEITKPSDLTVTYSTDDETVATVNASTGEVTGVAEGTATITASWDAVANKYNAGSASYTVNVIPEKQAVIFEKVTSANQLVAGNEYILVATNSSVAMGPQNETKYRSGVDVKIENNQVVITDQAVAVLTLGGTENAWTFLSADNSKYLGLTANDNNLFSVDDATTVNNHAVWSISDDFQLVNNGYTDARYVKYNSSNPRFACYKSGQQTAVLFMKQGGTVYTKSDPEFSFGETTAFTVNAGKDFTAPTLTTAEGYDGTVTYSSSDEDMAVVDAATGEVVIGDKAGTVTITASAPATEKFLAGEASYTITVVKPLSIAEFVALADNTEAILNFDAAQVVYKNGDNMYVRDGNDAINLYQTSLTWELGEVVAGTLNATKDSYKNTPQAINVTGQSIESAGTEDVVATSSTVADAKNHLNDLVTFSFNNITTSSSSSSTYYYATSGNDKVQLYNKFGLDGMDFSSLEDGKEYKVTGIIIAYNSTIEICPTEAITEVVDERDEAGIAFNPETLTITEGETFTQPTFVNPNSLTVTFESDNEDVAMWDEENSELVLMDGIGTAVITASFAGNTSYKPAEATLTVTVNKAPIVLGIPFHETFDTNEGSGGNDGNWSGSIASSDFYSDYEGWTNEKANGANHCVKAGSSKAGGSLTTPTLPLEEGKTYTLTFKAAAWDSTNEKTSLSLEASSATLSVEEVETKKGAWTDYTVTISNATGNGTIKFYTSAGNSRFFLDEVKVVESEPVTATITAAGYATFANAQAVDFSAAEGLTVLTAKYDAENDKIVYNEVTSKKVPAGVAVVLKGTADDYEGKVIASADALENNGLKVDLTNNTPATGKEYCLARLNGVVGFYKVATSTYVKAGKAYLEIERPATTGGAKDFYAIEDETDGINAINNSHQTVESVYNLSGQRVNKAQKGIYIVNGKKVVVR